MNILPEVIIPLSGVVFPAVVAFIRAVYNRWGEGRNLHRDSQFDKVNMERRLAIFRRINQLKNKNDLTSFDLLAIKALYEGIGIRYPVAISHKILEYIASNNIDFNEPTLNSFLRMSRLINVTDSEVTQPSSKRKKARREIVIFGGVMIAAIIYAFFMSVPDIIAEMSGAAAVVCFVVLFLVYLAIFITIVSNVINSLYDIQCAKKFWKTFSPFLNGQP